MSSHLNDDRVQISFIYLEDETVQQNQAALAKGLSQNAIYSLSSKTNFANLIAKNLTFNRNYYTLLDVSGFNFYFHGCKVINDQDKMLKTL